MSHPTIPSQDAATLRTDLRTAVQELMDRGLNSSAKWSAELLHSLPTPPDPVASTSRQQQGTAPLFRTSTPVRHPPSTRQSLPGLPPMSSIAHVMGGHRDSLGSVLEMGSSPAAGLGAVGGEERMEEDHWTPEEEALAEGRRRDEEERDMYMLALAYERTHEHMRAAHILRGCEGPKARWLRGYAKYLVRWPRCSCPVGVWFADLSLYRPARSARRRRMGSCSASRTRACRIPLPKSCLPRWPPGSLEQLNETAGYSSCAYAYLRVGPGALLTRLLL